jgi:ribonucleoside-diphosphate reductase alpha chain
MELSENAQTILNRRYLRRDELGRPTETPESMFYRVARAVAEAETQYGKSSVDEVTERFQSLMSRFDFLPNSPTLMNAGTDLGQLSACFVLPLEDSMESIYATLQAAALVQKSGGGTGFSFSRLRPKGDIIHSTHGTTSGPISFLKLFNFSSEVTKMGGTRSGANMAVMRYDHPDIMEFVRSKRAKEGDPIESLSNFNISVGVTEHFFRMVKADHSFPLINPRDNSVRGRLSSAELFDEIVRSAWACGDPGLVFLDRINRDNPTPHIGSIEATNPCGEQPLLPYEACNLGSINLVRFVRSGQLDYERLGEVIPWAVRFLDNVVDVSRFPLVQIRDTVRANRKIGLGVMGFADLLVLLRIPYDHPRAWALGEDIMRFINDRAKQASAALAEERGPFPNWRGSLWQIAGYRPLRNATVTTIAPTGTIALIADCSSGIEPLYALAYVRRAVGSELVVVNSLFQKAAESAGILKPQLLAEIADRGSVQKVSGVPEDIRRLFVTAHDIDVEAHVQVQAAFQRHTDNGVSKTINLPHDATLEKVRQAYLRAYDLGLKGVTVFRDRSRSAQVLAAGPRISTESGDALGRRSVAAIVCPDCGEALRHESGCVDCSSCGYSLCST